MRHKLRNPHIGSSKYFSIFGATKGLCVLAICSFSALAFYLSHSTFAHVPGMMAGKSSIELRPQTKCPILGGGINRSLFADYDKHRIYVCSKRCIPMLKKNAERVYKLLEADGVILDMINVSTGKVILSASDAIIQAASATLQAASATLEAASATLQSGTQEISQMEESSSSSKDNLEGMATSRPTPPGKASSQQAPSEMAKPDIRRES